MLIHPIYIEIFAASYATETRKNFPPNITTTQ